jgi:hypothetical protein
MARRALQGISARRGGFTIVPVQETARGVSIPAPVQGWDAISPLAAMPETSAIALENVFPQPGYVEIRKGHKTWNHLTGTPAVESLMAYNALAPANDKLFAAASTAIYDVTTFATATTSAAAVSSLTNARFQHLNVSTTGGNFLWICNGADAPRTYDGTNWATASITGITASTIINCALFKERIWLVREGQISPAYLGLDSIQGAATVFDMSGVFAKGGYLMAIGCWSLDAGNGPDDYIAFVTSRGEVAIYTGTDPGGNFIIKGVYEMGAPIGRRCLTKVGADLAVVCVDGVVPLSKALITDRAAAITVALTAKIQPVVNTSAREYGANFGWQLQPYAKGTRAILNVPITENVLQEQYVMNTVTGAWCRFKGENANCWETFKDRLFYGGNDGNIKEADCQGFDDDAAIEFNVENAFNYCGTKGRLKQFVMARALLTTDGRISPGLAVNVDFSRNATVDVLTSSLDPQALWNVASWDQGVWPEVINIVTDWISVAGHGYSASIRMNGSIEVASGGDTSEDVTLQINGWDMLVLDGGFL